MARSRLRANTESPAHPPLDIANILNHVSSIVLVVAADGNIKWASPSTKTCCGWTAAELEHLQWHTLVHPGDVSSVRELVRSIDAAQVELRIRGAAGRYRWHRAAVEPLTESGAGEYVVELFDVDEEVRLRIHVEQSEASLRRLFNEIPDAVVEWLPVRNPAGEIVDLKVVRANQAFNNRFGGDSVEGRLASEFVRAVLPVIPRFEQVVRDGGELNTAVDAGVEQYQLHLSATPRSTVMCVSRAILGTEDPGESVREEAEHLARVAHTLRTNLSVVQGWTELLADADANDDPETRHQAVESLSRNTSTLLTSVNELMAATAGNGRYRLGLAGTDLGPVLRTAIDDLRATHREIHFELRGDSDVVVQTNPNALCTVLRHLLENAARFATSSVVMTAERKADRIEIEVIDDGPGIAADVELFTAFTPNHHGNGNGVGLNVVKKLVEALGGTISAENRSDGSGACFRVTIPMNQAELSSR